MNFPVSSQAVEWLKISIREIGRAAATDLHTKSIFIIFAALVFLPMDVLPGFYTEFAKTLTLSSKRGGEWGFGLSLCIFTLLMSVWRRKSFGGYNGVKLIEMTLPINKVERFIIRVVLGLICHSPVFMLVMVAALTSIMSKKMPLLSFGHLAAFMFLFVNSIAVTELIYYANGLKEPLNVQRNNFLGSKAKRRSASSWCKFLGLQLLRNNLQRFAFGIGIIIFLLFVILIKDYTDIHRSGLQVSIFFGGFISMILTWIVMPLIEEGEPYQKFLTTLPSKKIRSGYGEFAITSWITVRLFC